MANRHTSIRPIDLYDYCGRIGKKKQIQRIGTSKIITVNSLNFHWESQNVCFSWKRKAKTGDTFAWWIIWNIVQQIIVWNTIIIIQLNHAFSREHYSGRPMDNLFERNSNKKNSWIFSRLFSASYSPVLFSIPWDSIFSLFFEIRLNWLQTCSKVWKKNQLEQQFARNNICEPTRHFSIQRMFQSSAPYFRSSSSFLRISYSRFVQFSFAENLLFKFGKHVLTLQLQYSIEFLPNILMVFFVLFTENGSKRND